MTLASTKDLGVSVRLIGAGPNGETVVIEASDDPSLQERLQSAFEARHGSQ